MKPSILRNLLLASLSFGLLVGALFPVYAGLFVEWRPGMRWWFAGSCLVAGAGIGVINYWLVKVILLRRLEKIAEVATAIGQNDMTRSCVIESDDVVGDIIGAFNTMAGNLRRVIGQIGGSTAQLAAAAEQTSAVNEEMSRGVRQQQAEIDSVADAMSEMATTVQDVARNAVEASGAAGEADQEARNGALVATEALGGIDSLVRQMESAGQAIRDLEQHSENIGSVLDVIRSIAEQTNLLALNAAIEAARAGEQGRGFAVVADEVRTLASRTQQSTQEIHDMIQRLQDGAANAVKVMEAAQTRAHSSSDQIERAAESLAAIAGSVAAINEMNTRIAAAAEQQNAVAADMRTKMDSIRQVADHSADGATQTAQASEELARLAAEQQTLMAAFKM
ncbi:MAG TPA: methyl-accepting chemotaxis protein [Gammaproteobacteria bacterium]|nr:methyl-accepting chemotaxis protein [Gammaproteobacteria bacterium]